MSDKRQAGSLRGGCLLLLVTLVPAATLVAQPASAPPPQVAISPSRFELEIGGKPVADSFRVINLGQEPLEVQVSVATWEMDSSNRVMVVAPTEQSLDQWMVINPLRFTIPPSQSQTVRFSIRPRVRPEAGEHRAMIYLDQILPAAAKGSGIRLRFQYGVAVYGYAGEVTRQGTLHAVEATSDDPLRFGFDLSSTGNAHVRMAGRWAIWSAAAYSASANAGAATLAADDGVPEGALLAGDLPSLPVLPGTRRTLPLEPSASLPPGDYVLVFRGSLHDQAIERAIPFSVPFRRQEDPGR